MTIHEALILSEEDLKCPSGVLFYPREGYNDEDVEAWEDILPSLLADWQAGNDIMVLVQARDIRPWDDTKKNYTFKPKDDYLLAAYSIAPSTDRKYTPSTCTNLWLDGVIGDDGRNGSQKITKMFNCCETACKFSQGSALKLINTNMTCGGLPRAEAIMRMRSAMTKGSKVGGQFGWRGGTFPVRSIAGRSQRNAVYVAPEFRQVARRNAVLEAPPSRLTERRGAIVSRPLHTPGD